MSSERGVSDTYIVLKMQTLGNNLTNNDDLTALEGWGLERSMCVKEGSTSIFHKKSQ